MKQVLTSKVASLAALGLRVLPFAIAISLAAFSPYASAKAKAKANDASASYALLGPQFARKGVDSGFRHSVLERAHIALNRVPSPIRHIRIEGVSSGQTRAPGIAEKPTETAEAITRSKASLEDMEAVFDLALAWRMTGEETFLKKAFQYLDVWVTTYELSFNPIDEGRFDNLVLAYDLVENDAPKRLRDKVDQFLKRLATGYIETMEAGNVPMKPTLTNNWQSHRIKLAGLASFQIGDDELIARVRALFNKQADQNLRADGTTIDFFQRDALHYVTYSVGSQLTVAAAARVHGQDWYSYQGPAGQSLPRTLHWLKKFASGQQVHIEFVNSVVPYDRQRAAAGDATYQKKPWDPATADQVYALAATLDIKWMGLSRKLQIANADHLSIGLAEDTPREWIYILRDGQ